LQCLAAPLATSSAHMQSVHGWPTADLNRLATNSCCLSDFESAKLHCVSHLITKRHDASRILDVMLSNPYSGKISAPSCIGNMDLSFSCKRVVTLCLTYHPAVSSSKVCRKIFEHISQFKQTCMRLLGFEVSVRVAWRNPSSHLSLKLRRATM